MTESLSQSLTATLRIEAAAIERAAVRQPPAQVNQAMELIGNCQGKLILIGSGKSGLIAQKIAATMTSTGTPAIYLHPSDALHGDIGIIGNADVALVLSNSGETDEVLALLPYLNHRCTPIVAITGGITSTLARNAAAVLDSSVDQEACPWNVVPTASTAVALALGDGLALLAMQLRGRTVEDFALNHPAGRLGKRLTLRVSDLMHVATQNPAVPMSARWMEVLSAISTGGLGAVNVVDADHLLVGIVTDGDLRRTLQQVALVNLEGLSASQIMTGNPITARPEMLAYDALQLMENRPSQVSVLPVVDEDGHCVGLLRLHDIVRSGI